ncbi:MAG: sugar isomerase domain-containing protein [Dictyoglomaceae bacterium]
MKYLEEVLKILPKIKDQEKEIEKAIEKIVEVIKNGGIIHIFGAGHSHILCEELFYRAGGFACINPIFDSSIMLHEGALKSSFMERLEGYGKIILDRYDLKEGEILFVISYSGRNALPIDVAIEGKRKGLFVIALTNLEYSKVFPSRHSSGKHLKDVADLIIPIPGPIGDASIELEKSEIKVGPISTVVSATILHTIFVEVAERLEKEKITPPIFISANTEGAEENNEKLIKKYKERIKSF